MGSRGIEWLLDLLVTVATFRNPCLTKLDRFSGVGFKIKLIVAPPLRQVFPGLSLGIWLRMDPWRVTLGNVRQ